MVGFRVQGLSSRLLASFGSVSGLCWLSVVLGLGAWGFKVLGVLGDPKP